MPGAQQGGRLGAFVAEEDVITPTVHQQFQHPRSRPSSSASGPTGSSSAPYTTDSNGLGGNLTSITSNNSSRVTFAGNVDVDVENELAYSGTGGSPYMGGYEIMFSGWNPDLPDPRLLNHLCVTMGPRRSES